MLSRIIIKTAAATAYSIDAIAGSYILTGFAITPRAERKNLADSGSYTLSGGVASLIYSAAPSEPENATDSGNPREHTYYAHWEALRLAVYAYYGIDPDKH